MSSAYTTSGDCSTAVSEITQAPELCATETCSIDAHFLQEIENRISSGFTIIPGDNVVCSAGVANPEEHHCSGFAPNNLKFSAASEATSNCEEYAGCYIDTLNNVMQTTEVTYSSSMLIENAYEDCRTRCLNKGFDQYGLKQTSSNENKCFCGLVDTAEGEASYLECANRCSDNSGWTTCGGEDRMLVYRILQNPGESCIRQTNAKEITSKKILEGLFSYYQDIRDQSSGQTRGLYCAAISLSGQSICGENADFYGLSGSGYGLISLATFTEMGYYEKQTAANMAVETIQAVLDFWPTETFHGYRKIFTNSNNNLGWGQYSTVETAMFGLAAQMVGKYFGGQVQALADEYLHSVDWSASIIGLPSSGLYMVVNGNTGALTHISHPTSHFYSLAYMAKRYEEENLPGQTKCRDYFEQGYGTTGKPVGINGYPQYPNYWGYVTIAQTTAHAQANTLLWPYYLSKAMPNNPYMSNYILKNAILQDRLFADKSYTYNGYIKNFWDDFVEEWNVPDQTPVVNLYQRLYGLGSGSSPTGYGSQSVGVFGDIVMSTPVMAGYMFDKDFRTEINYNLEFLYENDVCTYEKTDRDGKQNKLLWRCSIMKPAWRSTSVETTDYAPFLLGFSQNWLPDGFYQNFGY